MPPCTSSRDWCEKLLKGNFMTTDDPSFEEFLLFAASCVQAIWLERNFISQEDPDKPLLPFRVHYSSLLLAIMQHFCRRKVIHSRPNPNGYRLHRVGLKVMWMQPSECIDPLFVEATALLTGLELARDKRWKHVVLESNCEVMVKSYNHQQEVSWNMVAILAQALTLPL
ncbi:hypothetical protein TorRG33x02_168660 [Trema orientale]|uniref:RNase H type-1 domain-containing protein n=1 Tax=Trema orientale TaxID=63057 RepID=A0A2P5EPA7_TREOI|nr:hypothetical protein TorRG33x02_168660 [Trema orientale]